MFPPVDHAAACSSKRVRRTRPSSPRNLPSRRPRSPVRSEWRHRLATELVVPVETLHCNESLQPEPFAVRGQQPALDTPVREIGRVDPDEPRAIACVGPASVTSTSVPTPVAPIATFMLRSTGSGRCALGSGGAHRTFLHLRRVPSSASPSARLPARLPTSDPRRSGFGSPTGDHQLSVDVQVARHDADAPNRPREPPPAPSSAAYGANPADSMPEWQGKTT